MSPDPLWYQKGVKPTRHAQPQVPTPAEGMGHILPFVGTADGENWHQINRALKQGGNSVKVAVLCVGCGTKGTAIIADPTLFDQVIKVICPDCLNDQGFAWASTLSQENVKHYQFVKQFPDDRLMRLISKSPNFKEEVHKPIDSVEEAVRSLTKKGATGSIDTKDLPRT